MNSNRAEYSFTTLALAFVIGGLVGTGLGFLFAPQTGRETREKIKEWGEESLKKNSGIRLRPMVERAKGLAEAGKEKFSEVREKVQESIARIKNKVSPKKGEEEVKEA